MTDCTVARLNAKGDSPESTQLLKLLRLPIRAGQSKQIADRLRDLRTLFGDLPRDRAKKLLARLNDKKDLLGVFFDCELRTETRKELRGLLAKNATPPPQLAPTTAGTRAIDNRGTTAPAVKNRGTGTPAAPPIARGTTAPQTGTAAGGGAPAVSTTKAPIDCAAEWQKYETSAQHVIGRGKPSEHRLRNMLITAHYALLYLGNHEFKWAGFAAYASKQVGCAMDHGQRISRLAKSTGDYYPMKQKDEEALDSWDELGVSLGGYGAAELADYMYAKLGEGNQKLFLDIYPAHLFFIDHGYQRMVQCAKGRRPSVPDDLLEGFRLIEESRNNPQADEFLRESVAAMVRHEQLNVLQSLIYEDKKIRAILDLNELDLPGTDPAKAILIGGCDDAGEQNTYYLNDTGMGDKDLYNTKHRMDWILNRIAPHYFALEGTPRHIEDLKALTNILYY